MSSAWTRRSRGVARDGSKSWLGGERRWSAGERRQPSTMDNQGRRRRHRMCRDEVKGRLAGRAGADEVGAIGAPGEWTIVLYDIRLEDVMNEVRRLCGEQPQ